MPKRRYAVLVVVLLALIALVALNGDRLYHWLLRMHGIESSH